MGTPRITRRRVLAVATAVATTATLTVLVQTSGRSAGRPAVLAQQAVGSAATPVQPDPVPTDGPAASPIASVSAVEASPFPKPVLAVVDDSGMVLPPSCGGPDNIESCPDGQPGWYSGFTACTVPTAQEDAPGDRPVDGMTLALTFPQSQVTAGQALTGTLTATNPTDYRVSFNISYLPSRDSAVTATVLGPGGAGAVYSSDVFVSEPITLEPSASVTRRVIVPTATCGDTSSDPEVPLDSGEYTVTAAVSFRDTKVEPSTDPTGSPDATTAGSPSQLPSPGASNQSSPTPNASESPAAPASASPSPTAHNEGTWVGTTSLTIR